MTMRQIVVLVLVLAVLGIFFEDGVQGFKKHGKKTKCPSKETGKELESGCNTAGQTCANIACCSGDGGDCVNQICKRCESDQECKDRNASLPYCEYAPGQCRSCRSDRKSFCYSSSECCNNGICTGATIDSTFCHWFETCDMSLWLFKWINDLRSRKSNDSCFHASNKINFIFHHSSTSRTHITSVLDCKPFDWECP